MGTHSVLLLILCAVAATAQEDHSQHQHAVAGLGTVDFRTSCNAAAQASISRAAALLHSFGYEESRIAFNDAAKADPSCAMAYWGVARTWYHPIWAPPSPEELKQGAAAMDRALAIDAKTGRERDYIQALSVFYKDWQTVDHATRAKNYERALAGVCERNPNDDEAAIFHALQLVAIGYLDPTDKSYTWQKKGSEILNGLLARHQNHPGVAHYIIHSVDYPPLAELGLKAARAYAAIAPDSPHALHMPSHIFTRLGLWDDSIASNSASTKSAIAQSQRLHGGGGSFDQLHAIDYLVYAYLQQAKDASAQKVLAEMQAHDPAGRKPVRRCIRIRGLAGTLGFGAARLESGSGVGNTPGMVPLGPVSKRGSAGALRESDWCGARGRCAGERAVRPTKSLRSARQCRQPAITIGAARSARSGKRPPR